MPSVEPYLLEGNGKRRVTTLIRTAPRRGLDDEDDLFTPGTVELPLDEQTEVVVVIGTEPIPPGWDVAASSHAPRQRQAALRDPAPESARVSSDLHETHGYTSSPR